MASRKDVAIIFTMMGGTNKVTPTKAKSCSAKDGVYYSYDTPIAKWVSTDQGKKVVIDNRRYSITTSRHLSELIGALDKYGISYTLKEGNI